MITHLFFFVLLQLLKLVLHPLFTFQDVALDPALLSSVRVVGQFLATMPQSSLPNATLLAIISLYVSVEVVIFVYKGIIWLIKKIPTIN